VTWASLVNFALIFGKYDVTCGMKASVSKVHNTLHVTSYVPNASPRVKIMSPLFNKIEQCFAVHVVHTCHQY
jgi:hypothetical protein